MKFEQPALEQEVAHEKNEGRIEKFRGLIDDFAKTKKALPVLGIMAMLGSFEAHANEDTQSHDNLIDQYETIIDNHDAGPDLKIAIEDFEKNGIESSLDPEDEILFAHTFTYSSGDDTEPTYSEGHAGEIPHVGTNITIDGGTAVAVYSDSNIENSRLWEGVKYRMNVAAESDEITPTGETIENTAEGDSPEAAIMQALTNELGVTSIDTENKHQLTHENEESFSGSYERTDSTYEAHIASYKVLNVDEIENEDGTLSYSASLSIKPGTIEQSESE